MAKSERLYQEYKDVVDFYYIYIAEAHALDDARPQELAQAKNIFEHKTYTDRCTVGTMMAKDLNLQMPVIVDGIDNAVTQAYNGRPTRAFIVRKDGFLGVTGKGGSRSYRENVEQMIEWLAQYKKTGKEPALPKK